MENLSVDAEEFVDGCGKMKNFFLVFFVFLVKGDEVIN